MSQLPKIGGGRRVSATVEKATELEVAASTSSPEIPRAPAVPSSASVLGAVPTPPASSPGSSRTVRPPPPVPARAGTQPPPLRPSVRGVVKNAPAAGQAQKSTIHLGDGDLEPLSSLAVKPAFSIRRGLVLGGRFRVKELIGAGAQCYVYSAEHTTLKNAVAIKCLQPELVTPDLVERFAREAQALTAIRNAHVAAVLDVGRAPCGTPFIVMEYLQGRDLAALLETRPRLEPRQATEILLQTCEGLAAAHALGLVHQDIKPSNIFLSDEMGIVKAKVVDFGVARVAPERKEGKGARFARSQLDDTVGGTPFYMPPEQFFAESTIDPRSDIFSLGMVLYEMLRGTHAFDLEMSTRLPGDPVRIQAAGIDPALVAVVERCLEQKPEARFESVAELAVALLPFAPSRSRSHAEAAAALLRKAGLSVASTMPSSIPPPMNTSMSPTSAQVATVMPQGKRSARWPLYVGAALAVTASAVAFVALTRSPKAMMGSASAATSVGTASTAAAEAKGPEHPAIAINPVVRTTPAPTPEPSASATALAPSAPPFGARPGPGGAPGPGLAKAGAAASASKAGAKAAADAASASASAGKPAAAPATATGTAEDLGF